ncbi:MAG: hypothetical protein NZ765_07060 [Anaerolineae bacterium]|nr:hypothetical protein [Anaerolineae bacterium]MDW8071049.1 hypothetical protein [Anaerolineae bacterium]
MRLMVLFWLLACTIALIGLSSCRAGAPAPTRTRAPSVGEIMRMITKTPTPTTPADEPDKRETKLLVLRAQARLALLKSYRARVVDEAGRTLVLFEYVRPDRYRQVSDTKEQIGIKDLLYTRAAGGPWTKQEWPGIGRLMNEVTIAPEFIWDVENQGRESVEGVLCHRVRVMLRVGDTQLTDIYWIGVDDRLPRKMTTQVDEQTYVTKFLYDFNQDVQIEPPQIE